MKFASSCYGGAGEDWHNDCLTLICNNNDKKKPEKIGVHIPAWIAVLLLY